MKKDNKLYVARFVPYSSRVRRRRIFVLKTAAITAAVCLALISVTVLAARKMPRDFYISLFRGGAGVSETASDTAPPKETAYVYPMPSADIRAKADRLREIKLDDWNAHSYLPSDGELDNVYLYDNKKMCYLTFDDGPSAVTGQILDILSEYKVKATFFVTGAAANAHKDLVKRIYDEGHTIGNHSHTHDYNTVYSSREGFIDEVISCKNAIDGALGFEYDNLVFRFPGGYVSLTDENTKAGYVSALKELGYKYIDWSCLTGDGNVTDPTVDYLVNTLKFGIGSSKTGDIVVLMHDSSTKQATADALAGIIEYLYESRYRFGVLNN